MLMRNAATVSAVVGGEKHRRKQRVHELLWREIGEREGLSQPRLGDVGG